MMNTQENLRDQLTLDDDYSSDMGARLLSSDTTISPTLSSTSSGAALFPKGNITKPAATRNRRSRASKKAPMTLLNASPNNFRALVQQFTGCHSAPAAFGTWKGPINLNFAQYSCYSEKSEPQQQQGDGQNSRAQDSAPSFSSLSTVNKTASMAAAAPVMGDHVNSSRPAAGPLLSDFYDLDNMEILPAAQAEQPGGPADYYSASPEREETWHDDFWGH